jgi:hypothetical protein
LTSRQHQRNKKKGIFENLGHNLFIALVTTILVEIRSKFGWRVGHADENNPSRSIGRLQSLLVSNCELRIRFFLI